MAQRMGIQRHQIARLQKAVLRCSTAWLVLSFLLFSTGCNSAAPGKREASPAVLTKRVESAGSRPWQRIEEVDSFVAVEAAPEDICLYWKDSAGNILGSLGAAQRFAEQQGNTLRFLMNAGMYTEAQTPLGLLIYDGKMLHRLNRDTGYGNFYLRPNGVFFITKTGKAGVCRTQDFAAKKAVRWATQSGPMLLIDGRIHPAFKDGSMNVNIRNGVGILPSGHVLLGIAPIPVSLWDFAQFFKRRGCENALYLDGAISRAYFPEGGLTDTGGSFGVMVGARR